MFVGSLASAENVVEESALGAGATAAVAAAQGTNTGVVGRNADLIDDLFGRGWCGDNCGRFYEDSLLCC